MSENNRGLLYKISSHRYSLCVVSATGLASILFILMLNDLIGALLFLLPICLPLFVGEIIYGYLFYPYIAYSGIVFRCTIELTFLIYFCLLFLPVCSRNWSSRSSPNWPRCLFAVLVFAHFLGCLWCAADYSFL